MGEQKTHHVSPFIKGFAGAQQQDPAAAHEQRT
jgi:hypothetical protein